MTSQDRIRAPRNRTITLTGSEREQFAARVLRLDGPVRLEDIRNRVVCQDLFEVIDWLPSQSVDLLFVDPPYNLDKDFNGRAFSKMTLDEYESWLDSWLSKAVRLLKPTSSVYICGDWRSSSAIHRAASRRLTVQNRISWEREKGRGANRNWKNCAEDIWFCTVSNYYVFNVSDVMLKRKVLAPYTGQDSQPKDWHNTHEGRYRLTHPSNFWSDITVPFWSMPENTDHPTQKPEKLLAKIVLASSNEGGVVLDPFLGSGTSAVVANKLNRNFIGIEIDQEYCCLALKRLELSRESRSVQGYHDGVFWERNSLTKQQRASDAPGSATGSPETLALFPDQES